MAASPKCDDSTMSDLSEPYHEGELAVQRTAGEQDAALQNAAVIADAVMPGTTHFLHAQRMLIVATRTRGNVHGLQSFLAKRGSCRLTMTGNP